MPGKGRGLDRCVGAGSGQGAVEGCVLKNFSAQINW